MRKWNASMPRDLPPGGAANVVVAFRSYSGARVELECEMSAGDARELMIKATQMMKAHKESKKEPE